MGGDDAPEVIVEGISLAAQQYPEVDFLLFGKQELIEPLISRHGGLSDRVNLVHSDEVILGTDKPSQALRRGRSSSMGLAIQAVADGEAQVAVSAGNTGALMALAKFGLRTLPGIERPALGSLMPTNVGESIMLDLGANVECSDRNLVQFAVMGAAFARTVLGAERPSVALLNIGVEELKGSDTIRSAGAILKEVDLPMEFAGFTEGNRISTGELDVIVTDGFTGNVALKTAEGTANFIVGLLKEAFQSSLLSKLGYLLARRGLGRLKDQLDPNNHNGAVFLGLNGLVVKSHGGATATGFSKAIRLAIDMAKEDLCNLISNDLKNFDGHDETPDKEVTVSE